MTRSAKPIKRRVSAVALMIFQAGMSAAMASDYPIKPVSLTEVSFTDGLWHDRKEINNPHFPAPPVFAAYFATYFAKGHQGQGGYDRTAGPTQWLFQGPPAASKFLAAQGMLSVFPLIPARIVHSKMQ